MVLTRNRQLVDTIHALTVAYNLDMLDPAKGTRLHGGGKYHAG
jgi:hypothetical protein